MKAVFKRHLVVHIWALGVLALFGVYWYGISSTEAANAVSRVTQCLKDGYARIWYLFPFSVVEWFYVFFILGIGLVGGVITPSAELEGKTSGSRLWLFDGHCLSLADGLWILLYGLGG